MKSQRRIVATVQAHLAEVSAIEKLEQMKLLIKDLAKGGNDDTKFNKVEEIIVKLQVKSVDRDAVPVEGKLKEMKAIMEELIEDTIYHQTDDQAIENLVKLEDMKELAKELKTLEDKQIIQSPVEKIPHLKEVLLQ